MKKQAATILCMVIAMCLCACGQEGRANRESDGFPETTAAPEMTDKEETAAPEKKETAAPETPGTTEKEETDAPETEAEAKTEAETEPGNVSYGEALSREELESARAAAKEYYAGTVYRTTELQLAADDCALYEGKTAGKAVVFQSEDLDRGNMIRYILLEKSEDGIWTVTNEGF